MAEQSQPATADRRTVLRTTALGVAAAGVGVTAAACSSANSTPQGSNAQAASAAGGATSTSTSGSGGLTVAAAKVPVDGGFIDSTNNVVVTQPSSGEYKAFTAICTHQGCTVTSVKNNVIQCPCHGSQFSAKDGSVVAGPATSPLASKTVSVSGSTVTYEA